MGLPVFCVENFWNVVMFAGHVVAGTNEASGNEAFHVGTGRRSFRDRYEPTTTDAEETLTVTCDAVRAADFFALDRDHNLGGRTVILERSNDDFVTATPVFTDVIPSKVSAPYDINRAPGVRNEEGAWLRRFPVQAGKYWRFRIPAMGAGLRPQIVNLYLGLSFPFSLALPLPFGWGDRELSFRETRSDTAWIGVDRPAQRFSRDIPMKFAGEAEYDLARYHFESLYLRRRPMWIVLDQSRAERSWLAMPPAGRVGFEIREGWGYMQGILPAREHEPKLI